MTLGFQAASVTEYSPATPPFPCVSVRNTTPVREGPRDSFPTNDVDVHGRCVFRAKAKGVRSCQQAWDTDVDVANGEASRQPLPLIQVGTVTSSNLSSLKLW